MLLLDSVRGFEQAIHSVLTSSLFRLRCASRVLHPTRRAKWAFYPTHER
jgi:hypothetical protein